MDNRNSVCKADVSIRHWFPIITFCPVNGLPDPLYITVNYSGDPHKVVELYAVRRKLRQLVGWRRMFMEQVAQVVLDYFKDAESVTVRLAFNRHEVTLRRTRNV